MLRDKPSGDREWKIAKVLRPLAQGPLTGSQAQVVAGMLGMHSSTVYRLRSRFLKGLNGYPHDL
jgi:putative transposase